MSWWVEEKDEKRLLVNLENPNVKFTDLLHNVAIYKLVRDRNFSTLTYLTNHIQEIIDTCFPLYYDDFSKEKNFDWNDSSRSFLLFTKAPPSLLEALFQNDAIYTQISLIFMKIHNGQKPPFFLLSRISSILAFIVSNVLNEVNNCIGFIYQLLPFKNEPGVFDLFEQICSSDSSFELMQKALVESHFSDHIIYEIKKRQQLLIKSNQKNDISMQKNDSQKDEAKEIPFQFLNDIDSQKSEIQKNDDKNEITLCELKKKGDTDNEKDTQNILIDSSQFITSDSLYYICDDNDPNHELHISLLLQIVRLCNSNQILKESFSLYQIIETFYSLTNSSVLILNELWESIDCLVDQKNESKMIVFLPKAIENIKEPCDIVSRYQVFSLDFIAKMMKLKSNGLSNDLIQQVQQIILRLIVQFPNSTSLTLSIFKLIKYGIVWNEFSDQFIENFVPLMIIEASNENRSATQAKSKNLLWKFNTKPKYKLIRSKLNSKIDNFNEFCQSVLDEYNQIMTSSYGGEIQALNRQSLFSPSYFIF